MNQKRPGGKQKASRRGAKRGGPGAVRGTFRSAKPSVAGGRFVAKDVRVNAATEDRRQPVATAPQVTGAARRGRVGNVGAAPALPRESELHEDYLTLIRRFPLRPIRDDGDYDAAVEVLDRLVTKDENDLTPGERDYLDALTRFVEDFDQRNYPVGPDARPPLARLKSLMETAELSPAGLGDIIGSRPAASMVLRGNRELSKAQIRKLAQHFKIDAGYFL